jgi:hypothetical protein
MVTPFFEVFELAQISFLLVLVHFQSGVPAFLTSVRSLLPKPLSCIEFERFRRAREF